MSKKILSLILACLLLLSLAACGGEGSGMQTTTVPSATDEIINEATTEATDAATEAPTEAPFEEIVIVDNDDYTFSITDIAKESLWGYTIRVFVENKTNAEAIFSWDAVSVNGFMCDPFWAVSLPAGLKTNEDISFFQEDFDLNGITEVTDITFTLGVSDAESWETLFSTDYTLYPLGEEAVTAYVREPIEGETVLFDNDSCTMIITGFDADGFYGYTANVYLENKTDADLMFSADGVSVNGFLCDPYWAAIVAAGKRCNTTISWFSEDFETNGITEVETITFPITVYDAYDWDASPLVDESFTVEP